MADLESLLNDLANLDAEHDLEGMRRIREQIVAEHPSTQEASEAAYKLGLDCLFRQRDLGAAVEHFLAAAKSKQPFWSQAARTSLGLCYFHQKKTQKALFELRRVAYQEQPNAHSVAALTFIETIYAEEKNKAEVEKARRDRIGQLEKLAAGAKEAGNGAERGYYLYNLGVALRDQGDNRQADSVLNEAKALGPDVLGADLYRAVVSLL